MFRVAGSVKDLRYAIIDGRLQCEDAGFRRQYSDKGLGKNQVNDPGQRPPVTAFCQPGRDHGNIKKVLRQRQQRGRQVTGKDGNISFADKGALKCREHAHVSMDDQRGFCRFDRFTHGFSFSVPDWLRNAINRLTARFSSSRSTGFVAR